MDQRQADQIQSIRDNLSNVEGMLLVTQVTLRQSSEARLQLMRVKTKRDQLEAEGVSIAELNTKLAELFGLCDQRSPLQRNLLTNPTDCLIRLEELELELQDALRIKDNKALARECVELYGKLNKVKGKIDEFQRQGIVDQELDNRFVEVATVLMKKGFGV